MVRFPSWLASRASLEPDTAKTSWEVGGGTILLGWRVEDEDNVHVDMEEGRVVRMEEGG